MIRCPSVDELLDAFSDLYLSRYNAILAEELMRAVDNPEKLREMVHNHAEPVEENHRTRGLDYSDRLSRRILVMDTIAWLLTMGLSQTKYSTNRYYIPRTNPSQKTLYVSASAGETPTFFIARYGDRSDRVLRGRYRNAQ